MDDFKVVGFKGEPETALMLRGPEEIAIQVNSAAGDRCRALRLGENSSTKWTHGFYFPGGVPGDVVNFCDRLQNCITVPPSESVDISLCLDWYKRPDEHNNLVDTEVGRLVHFRKYTPYPKSASSQELMCKLVAQLADLIAAHPTYRSASAITSPPGSKGDGTSFGEQLGQDVARRAGIPFVVTHGPERPPRKEDTAATVRDDFELGQFVDGTILLIDDVYRSGVTLESTARAALRAGASKVVTLTAVRTMRK